MSVPTLWKAWTAWEWPAALTWTFPMLILSPVRLTNIARYAHIVFFGKGKRV
jgi:hypothetical protein